MNKATALSKHIEFKRTSVKFKPKIKDIERYISLFINHSKKPLSKFDENDLTKFINSLEQNYSIGTINGIKSNVKVFIKWYYPNWSSKFRNLDKILQMQTPPRAYEPEQMIKFEDMEKLVKKEDNLMWKAYWLTLFYGGFRPSEACNLKWEQIYFEPQGIIIKIHTTKTNKDFYKSLPKEAEHLLKELKTNSNSELVFPSPLKKGFPILSRTACARLKRLSVKVLGREITPYILRHSIATILYNDDKRKDDDTANQLGHSKSMKKVYMNLDEDQMKANARKLWTSTKPLTKDEREELEDKIEDLRKNSVSKQDVMKLVQQALMKTSGEIKN